MAAHPVAHPSADALRALAAGTLDDATAASVLAHLDECPDCCRAAAAQSGDSLLQRLRAAHGRSSTPPPEKPLAGVAGAVAPPTVGSATPASADPANVTLPPELSGHPQYEVLRELGRGGMGVVYLAKNRQMDRLEVLKVVNRRLLDHPDAAERFLREIRSAARLNHPNIVTAYAAPPVEGLLLFAMEYVEGEDLARLVKRLGPLPVANACLYAHQAALGLHHAFEKGLVHRDIKPQNLILARDGKRSFVKILDFGLAKVTREKEAASDLTGEGKILGTPDYVAPEQTRDAAHADIRADVYSLGCTLYFLLTGKPPFTGRSLFELLQAHHTREATPLDRVRKDVAAELAAVVARMMAKDPAARYQTPLEVARALAPFARAGAKPVPAAQSAPSGTGPDWEAVTDGTPASETKQAPAPDRARPPFPKRALLIAGACAAGLLLLAGAAVALALVLRLRGGDGTLVVEVNEPGADVLVDGEKVTVSWQEGGKRAEVLVKPGTHHRVEVTKDGFTTHGEEVTLDAGGRRVLSAKLEPRRGPAPGPDGFVPLFNGVDLAGWKTHPAQPEGWAVHDGVLTGTGTAAGHLYTDRDDFADFHLRVKTRINAAGNASVLFRSSYGPSIPGSKPTLPVAYLAKVNTSAASPHKTGSLLNGLGQAGVLVQVAESPVPAGEWFTLEVIAQGNHLVVQVNGKTLADGVDEKRSFGRGHVALQALTAATVVEFKEVEIKELPRAPLEGAAARRFPAGVPPGSKGKWRVVGDYLEQTSRDENVIITFGEPDWTDYDFSAELMRVHGGDQACLLCRVRDSRNATLFGIGSYQNQFHTLEWVADGQINGPVKPARQVPGGLEPGVWYTAQVRVRGNGFACLLNGVQQIATRINPSPTGRVGLRTWASTYRFRNLKVTDPAGNVLLEGLPDLEQAAK
jgi:serine/threonine protein kinase